MICAGRASAFSQRQAAPLTLPSGPPAGLKLRPCLAGSVFSGNFEQIVHHRRHHHHHRHHCQQSSFCCAVENVAYKKSKWLNSFRRSYSKRHVGQTSWLPATPSRDVTSGDEGDDANDECVQLSSLYADRPTMKVDLGRRMDVSGAIVTGQKTTEGGCLGRCDRDNSHYWLILRIKLRKRT